MSLVYKIIRDRRSVRKYLPKGVSDNLLKRVLDAARWAPSAHNAQPWRFIVVKDTSIKWRLAEAMASEWNKDLYKEGVPLPNRQRLVKNSIEKFTQAPVIIVAFLTMEDMDKYPDKRRQKVEYDMAVQSVAAAIQNMLLVAYAEGLGACWFCAPMFCPEIVREVLKVPKNVKPQALITLGYPAERPKIPPRKPIEALVYQNVWGSG
jgi:F420 biosynthesis protein FbiB-like protein